MNIEIARPAKADQLLSDESFRLAWDLLCNRCPWATAYQSHRFARVWFSIYRLRFEPVLLMSQSAESALQGLLVLARSLTDGTLIVAGGIHAEYQSWVCEPQIGGSFPTEALAALRREFPGARLTFKYLPAGTPVSWLAGLEASRLCLLRTHRRPIWELGDGEGIAASLRKANNKNRLRQLKKLGPFEFSRVTDPAAFHTLFDEMIGLYDLRHGAVHGAIPFCSTDHQKEFHCAMLTEPGLMHVTAMRTGGVLAAAHFGVCSRDEVHFGTIVHDPRLAKHSPGKLQYLLLAQMLQREGFRRADLTPGDNAYKERHATAWDEVHTLSVLPTPLARAKAAVFLRLSGVVKKQLQRRGMTTVDARNQLRRLARPARAASVLLHGARSWVAGCHETRIYLRQLAAGDGPAANSTDVITSAQASSGQHRSTTACPTVVRRDAWGDLLAYRQTATGLSRQAFLSKVMARLEAGEHAYTASNGERLIYMAWMAERPDARLMAGVLPGLVIPPCSMLVHDLDLFEEAPSTLSVRLPPWASLCAPPALPALAVQAMLRDAGKDPSIRRAIVLVSGNNSACQSMLENIGFAYAGSIRIETRFGRRRAWAEGAEPLAAAWSRPNGPAPPEATGVPALFGIAGA